MTFQLTEEVKKEVLREYPNMHREYEFTIAIRAPNGKTWDGVGSCSTFEKKYRYRKGGRKCPQCGSANILESRKGPPGFFCWAKKGGCGAKFDIDDPRITNQIDQGQVENPDLADQWNTVRKVAFKRGLVHAAINATNTSELWTQDLEDKGAEPAEGEERQDAPGRSRPSQHRATPPKEAATPSAAPATHKVVPYADANTRAKMLRQFADLKIAQEFFAKLGWILPKGETVEDLPLQYVPITKKQNDALIACFKNFEAGGELVQPYKPNPTKPAEPAKPPSAAKPRDPEWWRDIICPIPPRGMKRDEYLKDPDTVGFMYDERHDPDIGKRLFGFIAHFEVKKSWTGDDGKERPNSAQQIANDTMFREALDACAEYAEKHKGDTEPEPQAGNEKQPSGFVPAEPEDDDVPF
jgi:hypothetical protein